MSFVNCFDVVSVVVEVADDRFSPIYGINKEKYDFLRDYCSVVDKISSEFSGAYYDAEVDEVSMKITVSFGCDIISIASPNHMLFEMIGRSCSVRFREKDGMVETRLTFPSIWDRV